MRIGIDVGGTFTDVVAERGDELVSSKLLTTSDAPEIAILEAIQSVIARAGASLADVTSIIHGTTLATNALIQRRGAHTALVTTQGFRDVIEMRTESRFEQYDLSITLPPALIERRHRYVLDERMDAQGNVLRPLQDDDVHRLVSELEAAGYESVAVGLIHSYRNDSHERRVREILQQKLPQLSISISSEVSPQMRELERFNTVCANAFVQPLMASYLHRLQARLQEAGAGCPIFMVHSGGGIMSLESAAAFPVRLVESGPAGGAIFAAHIASRYAMGSVLSYDMGGTTAKICLIQGQTPRTASTFEVARTGRFKKGSGMSISIPVIEMVEIGAGGGSIASVDVLGQIRVGPQSAGSDPGPSCYDRGGERPTVTDADLLLGRLSADSFAGGTMELSADNARQAVDLDVGTALHMSTEVAAFGICEVVDENMANAARVHAVESGVDLAGFTMIAFGGAAPLHAGRLCHKLGIAEFLVPPGAGVGSAIGFLRAPFAYEAVRSYFVRTASFDPATANKLLSELQSEAQAFVREGVPEGPLCSEQRVFMRYKGQGWDIPVALPIESFGADGGQRLEALFGETYERFFGRRIAGLAMEVVSWSVRVTSPVRPGTPVTRTEATGDAVSAGTRPVFDTLTGQFAQAAVLEREELSPGDRVNGPAVVVESQTTTYVPPDLEAVVQRDGCLLIKHKVQP